MLGLVRKNNTVSYFYPQTNRLLVQASAVREKLDGNKTIVGPARALSRTPTDGRTSYLSPARTNSSSSVDMLHIRYMGVCIHFPSPSVASHPLLPSCQVPCISYSLKLNPAGRALMVYLVAPEEGGIGTREQASKREEGRIRGCSATRARGREMKEAKK
jgi:hypothetical protein